MYIGNEFNPYHTIIKEYYIRTGVVLKLKIIVLSVDRFTLFSNFNIIYITKKHKNPHHIKL